MPEKPFSTDKQHLAISGALITPQGKRQGWALQAHGGRLSDAIAQDPSPAARELEKIPQEDQADGLVNLLMTHADPTTSKSMTPWLLQQYVQGGFFLKDADKALEILERFWCLSPTLNERAQNLHDYKDLFAVCQAVSDFASEGDWAISPAAQTLVERHRAYSESRILVQDPDGFTVVVPLTEFAAKWWGRGTEFLSVAEEASRFWPYPQEAPMITIIMPELGVQGKFQLTLSRPCRFVSSSNREIPEEEIALNWTRFNRVFRAVLKIRPYALWVIPERLRSPELCKIALGVDGAALYLVPEELRTKDICRLAVEQFGCALKEVPSALFTHELCELAVRNDGTALRYVPIIQRTQEICDLAVAQNPSALQLVPVAFRTEDICKSAVAQDGWSLKWVPQWLRTDDMNKIAVQQHGKALSHITKALHSQELCEIAIKNGGQLSDVPEDLRTLDLCKMAVCCDAFALKHVPKHLLSDELFQMALAENGLALSEIPGDMRNADLCLLAVQQNGFALHYTPREHCSVGLYEVAVKSDGRALELVPEALRDKRICKIALASNGLALQHVPEPLRTEEMCFIAVTKHGAALQWVPQPLRTEKLCLMAVRKSRLALDYLPPAYQTPMFYAAAAENDPQALEMANASLARQVRSMLPEEKVRWPSSWLDILAEGMRTPNLALQTEGRDAPNQDKVGPARLEPWEATLFPRPLPEEPKPAKESAPGVIGRLAQTLSGMIAPWRP
jgi:hypothetical protein